MNHRILAGILALLVLVAIALGFVLLNTKSDLACSYFRCWSSYYFVDVVYPFTRKIWPLAILFFALIFVKRNVFYTWLKLFVPLAVVGVWLVINSATTVGGWTPNTFPNRQDMTYIVVNILLCVSVLSVGAQYLLCFWRNKSSKQSQQV